MERDCAETDFVTVEEEEVRRRRVRVVERRRQVWVLLSKEPESQVFVEGSDLLFFVLTKISVQRSVRRQMFGTKSQPEVLDKQG